MLEALQIYMDDPCGPKPCPLDAIPCSCLSCRSGKPCTWPPLFQACAHIEALWESGSGIDYPIPIDLAAVLLEHLWPAEFAEPSLAPLPLDKQGRRTPEVLATREQALRVMNARANIQEADDAPEYALRRPDDVKFRHVDRTQEQGELGKRRSGLTTRSESVRRILAERAADEYRGPLDLLADDAVHRCPPRAVKKRAAA